MVLSAFTGLGQNATTAAAAATPGHAFVDFLTEQDMLDSYGRARLLTALSSSQQSLTTIILELGLFEENVLFDQLAKFLSFERVDLANVANDEIDVDAFDAEFLKRAELWPVFMNGEDVGLATANPLELSAARSLAYVLGRRLHVYVATPSALRAVLNTLSSNESALSPNDRGETEATLVESDAERLRDIASDAPIVRLLSRIVASAVERNASDIHIEPFEDRTRIRIRVDGVLQTQDVIDKGHHLGLVSRIKVLSKLNIAEQRLPQDGRIRLAVRGRDIDFRVATSPSMAGESVVLRILDRSDVALDLAALGFPEVVSRELRQLLQQPNGIILITGPTGSGKSTTLYAALQLLNKPEVKIFTVEDPVEYQIKGINQIAVRPQIGLDFAHVLRSVLRQDPDIIMIGEIRDAETAKIAVQASLTGHLVLSTLHTNSAAAAITRLRNLGVDDFLLASSLRGVMAQRLVRKSCAACSRGHEGTGSVSCKHCGSTGYRGRTVVHELLNVDARIADAIGAGQSDATIFSVAKRNGMQDLATAGQSLVSRNITTSEELLRVLAVP
jgi:general secretion pathway protein E